VERILQPTALPIPVLSRRCLQAVFAALLSLAFLIPSQAQTPLRVAAAADLEPLLPPILDQFRQATGIRAEATYQASAMLTTQIMNGAPFDVFLSADLGYPQKLIDANLGEAPGSKTPVIYAKGTLVLWVRKGSQLWPPSLELLRNPDLKRLAIANPDRAPYGRAAVAALTNLKLYGDLKPRLVIAENIAQAAQFVDSGNADAGLISLTSAMTQHMRDNGTWLHIDESICGPLQQGAVIVSNSAQRPAAQKFLDFLLSPSIQAQFAKSGLTPVH
jgi:molybdate transport system substrate-binding protein